jgi:mRNA (guanine-N7-)-methyltransferase
MLIIQDKVSDTFILGVYKSNPKLVELHQSLSKQSHKGAQIYLDSSGTIGILKSSSSNAVSSSVKEEYLFECLAIGSRSGGSSLIPNITIGSKRKIDAGADDPAPAVADFTDQETAANHYGQGLVRDIETRSSSQIFHLRNLNGYVKSVLINTSCSQLAQSGVIPPAGFRVLDLCCGHGGDVHKWLKNNPLRCLSYVGVDIAEGALKDFISSRLDDAQYKSKVSSLVVADMGVHSLSSSSLLTFTFKDDWKNTIPLSPQTQFEVVSCQFAMHYMFASKDRANSFFSQVNQHLVEGGLFIATTVDSRVFLDHVYKTYCGPAGLSDTSLGVAPSGDMSVVIKNDLNERVCQIHIKEEIMNRLLASDLSEDELYGLRYNFQLFDTSASPAVDAPEWLVPLGSALEELALKHNLIVKSTSNFHQFVTDTMKNDKTKMNM